MSGMSARDAVFLAEMGIGPLWTLRDAPAAEEAAAVEAEAAPAAAPPRVEQAASALQRVAQSASALAAPAPRTEPAPAEVSDADIAAMDWDQLRAAVASCSRCGACAKDGRKPVFGMGPARAQWLVAAGASTAADEGAGAPLAGDTGKLLDNMLFAIGASREADVYVTNLVKCRPSSAKGGDRAPTAEEAAACRPYLERELALTGAGTVLTLGQIAANGLLGQPLSEPLAGSRGSVHDLAGVPLVATLHPGELLRRGADKAQAWADLCRARAARARPG
jgi:DNA polymerase